MLVQKTLTCFNALETINPICDAMQGFIQDCRFGGKTSLPNRLSDSDLEHLMKIAIEGPSVSNVDCNEILDIFKQKNRRISL